MIQLTCQNCSTPLELDNAFAGGVCRCRHCGHLQKVPANAPVLPDRPARAAPASRAAHGSPTTLIIVLTGIVALAAAGAYFLLR